MPPLLLPLFTARTMRTRGGLAFLASLCVAALTSTATASLVVVPGEESASLLSLGSPSCRLLYDLYQATGGSSNKWRNDQGWSSPFSPPAAVPDCCKWYGVTCDAAGQVVELDLWSNGLEGGLPSSLGGLSTLQGLYLHGNALTGSIPSTLGNLTQLRELDLAMNHLSGPLPASLARLGKLERVSLFSNDLSGRLEGWWGKALLQLRSLSMSNNRRLGGPIPEFYQPFLEEVDLMNGAFNGSVPSSLLDRPSGFRLYLSSNNLTSLHHHLTTPPLFLLNTTTTTTTTTTCFLSGNPLSCPLPRWATTACAATCGPRIAVSQQQPQHW